MFDLTDFQRDLLYVVADNDGASGLAIKDDLEEYYDDKVRHGRLYPNLDTLVEKGLVSKTAADKRTNAYSLTPRGKRELRTRQEWIDARLPEGVEAVTDG